MQAAVGDHMVVVSPSIDRPVRDGEVLRVGPGGSGPYLVRWSDTGRETLFFPGPDARVEHPSAEAGAEPVTEASRALRTEPPVAKHWTVDVYIYESGPATSAQAVLHGEAPQPLASSGRAKRNPDDRDVPEIGDEVAVARALRHLADRLLGTAAGDIAAVEGHPVTLHP